MTSMSHGARTGMYFSTLLDLIRENVPKKETLSHADASVVFVAIWMLERHHRIPSD